MQYSVIRTFEFKWNVIQIGLKNEIKEVGDEMITKFLKLLGIKISEEFKWDISLLFSDFRIISYLTY